jgi:hypothetical protein
LAVFAVLFAPAADRWLKGSADSDPAPVEARILAPTIREAVAAASPKRILHRLPTRDHPSPTASVTEAVTSSAAARRLVWAFLSAGLWVGTPQRVTVLRELAPRAPPPAPVV